MVSRRVWAAPAPASPRPISAVATVGCPRTSRMVPSQTWMSDVIHTSPACKGAELAGTVPRLCSGCPFQVPRDRFRPGPHRPSDVLVLSCDLKGRLPVLRASAEVAPNGTRHTHQNDRHTTAAQSRELLNLPLAHQTLPPDRRSCAGAAQLRGCTASAGSTGSHCERAKWSGKRITGGPLPCA